MMSALRLCLRASAPATCMIAAVAIQVCGHSELTATLPFSSAARPSVTRLMLYFAIVYAGCGPNHFGLRFNGGDSVRMCGVFAFRRCGRQARLVSHVPR